MEKKKRKKKKKKKKKKNKKKPQKKPTKKKRHPTHPSLVVIQHPPPPTPRVFCRPCSSLGFREGVVEDSQDVCEFGGALLRERGLDPVLRRNGGEGPEGATYRRAAGLRGLEVLGEEVDVVLGGLISLDALS